jgi:hypothetical protein
MSIHALTLANLTPDQVQQLDALVGQVMAHGFGQITITIEKGRTVRVIPAPSLPFYGQRGKDYEEPAEE